MEYHYTYLLICKETQQKYIGVRTSRVLPIEDKYLSSSRTVSAMLKQGYTFDKHILSLFDSRTQAQEHEIELHKKYDVARSEEYLNKSVHVSSGFSIAGTKLSEETKKRMSESRRGKKRGPLSEEHKEKLRRVDHSYTKTEEYRLNMKKVVTGRTHSEETKRKQSVAHLGRKKSIESVERMRKTKTGVSTWKETSKHPVWEDIETGIRMTKANFKRWHPSRINFIRKVI